MEDSLDNMAEKKAPIRVNFIFNLIIQVTGYLVSLVIAPYLSRILGVNGIGDYTFAASIVNYFMIVVTFGFRNYGTQKIAKERDDKQTYSNTFWSIFFSRFVLFTMSLSIYFILILLNGFGGKVDKNLAFILAINIFTCFIDTTYFYQAMEKFKALSLITLIFKICYITLIFIFVKTINDLYLYAFFSVGYTLVTVLVQWFFIYRFLSFPKFKNIHVLKTIAQGFIYFLPTIAITIYTLIDKTMLGVICSTKEVAYYEQAFKIVYIIISFLFALGTVILPRMSYLYEKKQKKEINDIIMKMSNVYALVAFPCVAGLYAISRYFIPVFFGDEFLPSVSVMYAMIPLICLMPLSNYFDTAIFLPNKRVKESTVFYYIAAFVNFGLNLFLIPLLGAIGAAISSTVSELVLVSIYAFFSRHDVKYKPLIRKMIIPFLCSIIMFLTVFLFNKLIFSFFEIDYLLIVLLDVLIGILVYVLFLFIFRESMVLGLFRKIFLKKK